MVLMAFLTAVLVGLMPVVAGPRPAVAAPGTAGTLGVWSAPESWPNIAVHLVLLPTGKVLSWEAQPSHTNADLWDPVTGSHTPITEIPYSLFCTGHTLLADGTVFIPGGSEPNNDGIIQTHIFDPDTMTFRRGPDMNAPRWYPSTAVLGTGEVLIVGGTETYADQKWNTMPQVYQPTTNSLRNLSGADRPFGTPAAFTDVLGGYYARMHVTPAGSVYFPSANNKQSWLDVSGTGSWTDRTASGPVVQSYNNSVLIEPNKALVVGGGWSDAITSGAQIVDITTGQITPTSPMSTTRKWQNSVPLPTGAVLTVGGEAQADTFPDAPGDPGHAAVLYAESWDRTTGTWTRRGDYTKQRYYHSTALLLPDGRVISVGGGQGQGFTEQRNAEIYTPWYLYKQDGSGTLAARPTINNVPAVLAYGASFDIGTSNAAAVSRVSLIRLGAVTHSQDFNGRFLDLPISGRTGSSVTTSLGNNRNEIPPGHYMLSIVDGAGVPSVSKIVKIGDNSTPPTTTPPAGVPAHRESVSATNGAGSTTLTLARPSTTAAGDVLIASVAAADGASSTGGGTTPFATGFETNTSDFAPWKPGSVVTVSTDTARTGAQSLKVTPGGASGDVQFFPPLTAAPTTLTLSVQGSGTIQPHLQYFTGLWVPIGSENLNSFDVSPTGFTTWTTTYTPPAGTGIIQIAFESASTNPWYLDDVALTIGGGGGIPGAPTTATAPSGWTQVTSNAATGVGLTTWRRVASATDPPSWTFGLSQTAKASGTVAAYTGVATATPIDVTATGTNNSSSTTQTSPSVTTTGANRLALTIVGSASAVTATAPAGSTERVDQAASAGSATSSIETSDFPVLAAGASGTKPTMTFYVTTSATATITLIPGGSTPPQPTSRPPGLATFVRPLRMLDTRPGSQTADGLFSGAGTVAAGEVVAVPIAGRAGVRGDASAAAMNVTATEATGAGFVTVFPCGSAVPNVSTVNIAGAGQTIANDATVAIGFGGAVCLSASVATHLIVDVVGVYPRDSSYMALASPGRLTDTRAGGDTVDGVGSGTGQLAEGEVRAGKVAGRAGVLGSASAATLNVTAVDAAGPGFLTVFPCGAAVPTASNLNPEAAGATIAASATVRIPASGDVCVFTSVATDLIVDVSGSFAASSTYNSLVAPSRLVDSRTGGGRPLAAGATLVVQVGGRAGVAADASAAVLALTATEASGGGFLTLYPCAQSRPTTSNLNIDRAGQTIANAATVRLDHNGQVCLYTSESTHVIVDVAGYHD
jgi:hypothetical protein